MSFDPQGAGGGGGGAKFETCHGVRDEASCVVQQQESSADSGSTLKAHDYIGLSEVSSMPAPKASEKALLDLNLGETELRLGPPKSVAPHGSKQVESKENLQEHWQAQMARNVMQQQQQQQQHQQQQQQQKQDKAQEFNGGNQQPSAKAGAKRGFTEAIGNGFAEGRSVMPSIAPTASAGGGAPAAPTGGAAAVAKNNPLMASPMYPWSASKQLPAAWRMGLEQSKAGSFGPFPSAARPKSNDGEKEKNKGTWESPSSSPGSSTKLSNGSSGISSAHKDDASDEVAPSSSPPVVGWPPVQSFRKTLASQPPPQAPQQKSASQEPKTSTATAATPAAAAPPAPGGGSPLFVKVYMDGVPIGRKVDLVTHSSYDKLAAQLEEMFHRYISEVSSTGDAAVGGSGDGKKSNFLHGSQFVLTYEDRDGDLMLVGDVPWGMFTGTVKRLRIMKGSEAIGLAPRAAAGDNKAV